MLHTGDDEGNDDGEGGDCYAKAFAEAKAKASASGDGNAKAEAKAKAEAEAKCKSEDRGNDDEGYDDRRRSLLSGKCGCASTQAPLPMLTPNWCLPLKQVAAM